MKRKSGLIFLLPVLCILVLATTVLAVDEPVPAPYTGVKNPFAWNDAAVQTAGKALYRKSCLSCHGANGNEVIEADFSVAEYPKKMENNPGFDFWRLSEGKGEMTAFKSTLSETQRWQVLTYIWSLGAVVPETPETPVTPVTGDNVTSNVTTGNVGNTTGNVTVPVVKPPPVVVPPTTLQLTVPEQAQAGQPLHISALLLDPDKEPIVEANVVFSMNTTFLGGRGLAVIGEALTDEKGVANITYTPQLTGNIPIVARYQPDSGKLITTIAVVNLGTAEEGFYETEVGLEYQGFPPDLVLFPESAWQPREPGIAPVTVLRIPGGLPFIPFTAYLATVILVWGLYVRVMYQVLRIPAVGKIGSKKESNVRLVPAVGIAIIVLLATLMVSVLVKGPYSGPYLH